MTDFTVKALNLILQGGMKMGATLDRRNQKCTRYFTR